MAGESTTNDELDQRKSASAMGVQRTGSGAPVRCSLLTPVISWEKFRGEKKFEFLKFHTIPMNVTQLGITPYYPKGILNVY